MRCQREAPARCTANEGPGHLNDVVTVALDPELAQALEAARERFGPTAIVSETTTLTSEGVARQCFVGIAGHDLHSWRELGRGPTWAEAIATAGR